VGVELGDVPLVFGWRLVLFESHVEETMSAIGHEPVPEPSETRTRHARIFLERLDDPFINLDPIRDLEEGDSPRFDTSIEIIQPKLIQILKPSEGQPKRRFKTFASRTNLQLVRKLRALHSGPSSAPSKSITTPTPASTKTSTKPSTKSAKKSSTCTQKSPEHARPSEQEPEQVEEIISSPVNLAAQAKEKAPAEQWSQQVPVTPSTQKTSSKIATS